MSRLFITAFIFLAHMQTLWSLTFNCICLITSDEREIRTSSLFAQAYLDWRVISLRVWPSASCLNSTALFLPLTLSHCWRSLYISTASMFFTVLCSIKNHKSWRCKHSISMMDASCNSVKQSKASVPKYVPSCLLREADVSKQDVPYFKGLVHPNENSSIHRS